LEKINQASNGFKLRPNYDPAWIEGLKLQLQHAHQSMVSASTEGTLASEQAVPSAGF
jgi:hypothetical protein